MIIRIIGVSMLIQQMDQADIKCLCVKYLHLDYSKLERSVVNDRLILEHLSVTAKPSVVIGTSTDIEATDCNVTIELKKSFFDAVSDEFELGKLLRYLSRYKHSVKQLVLTYRDDERRLSAKEIEHWCKNSADYCVGSFVKWNAPESASRNGLLRRITLGSTDSKSNYATIKIAPKSGRISFMITVRKKGKIQYVLDDYGNFINQIEAFEKRCRSLLVSCIDFVTPCTKKTRVKAKYVRQASWESFLGHNIESLNWSKICG